MRGLFVGLLCACGFAGGAAAAEPWTIREAIGVPENLTVTGAVRARYEVLDGRSRPGFGSGEDIVVLRTNIFAEYRTGPFRVGAEVFDSRAYGADRGGALSTTDVNALEPVQAYVAADLGAVLGPGSSANLQVGRMTLNLGSRRLVAADDYRNTTNGYTGAKLEARARAGAALTLIYVAPQVRLPDDVASLRSNKVELDTEGKDLVLWGGIASKSGLPDKALLELEYVGLDERDAPGRPTLNRNLHTYGARLFRAPESGRLDYELEVLRQTGTVRASTAAAAPIRRVSAGFTHAEVGYQFAGPWKIHAGLEYDHASGDEGAGAYNRFDTLFGMRRADYAPSGLFSAINRSNLRMAALRLEATPSPRWDVMAHGGPMWLDSATDAFATTGVRDPSGASGRFAGHMVEGRLRYWVVPRALRFEMNAVLLAKGRFLERAPNAPRTGDTKYLTLAMTASF